MNSYRDLQAWQKAMLLVRAVYEATRTWPHEELYGLTNQARRAAVIARDLKYCDEATRVRLLDQAAEVGRLLYGLMRSLRT